MRVLHVIPSLAVRDGGPSRIVLSLCRALQARRLDPLIATTVADRDDVAVPPTGIVTPLDGLPVIGFARRGNAFKFSPTLSRWLRANVRDFDVVHIHAVFSHPSLAAGRACRSAGVPYIVRPLGSLDPWALSRRRWRKRLLRPAVQALIKGASAMHFTTDEEARLAGAAARMSAVIPSGLDDVYFEVNAPPMSEREPLVVAIARFHPVKRLDLLIQTFHSIAGDRSVNGWRLILAGDGEPDYRQELERLAAAGPAAGRIEFAGWLDEAQKRLLLSRASLVAAPSFQENFGLSLVEALACGVPAVVSRGVNLSVTIDLAGAGWIAGEGEHDLRRALVDAMRDTEERQARSVRAQRMAAQFTWASTTTALERLYASLRRTAVGGPA